MVVVSLIEQMAGDRRPRADDLVRVGLLAGAQRVEEIRHVASASIQFHLGVLEVLGLHLVEFLAEVDVPVAACPASDELLPQPKTDPASVAFDATLGTVEARTHADAVHHRDVTFVNQLRALCRLGVLGRDRCHRAALVLAQAPLDNVDVVRTPVADHAAAVLLVVAPVRVVAVHTARAEHGTVAAHWAGADPLFPVEARLHRLRLQIARHAGRADVDSGALDFADDTVAHQFAGHAKLARGTLHRAGLQNGLVLFHRLHHLDRLVDVVRERLLAVNILAGVHRGDGLDGMPQVRRGDAHRVDVVARDQLAKVDIGLTVLVIVTLVGGVTGGVATGGVAVRNGHADDVFVAHKPSLKTPVLDAHANETDGYLVIRLDLGRPDSGRQDERRAGNRRGLEKTTTGNRMGLHAGKVPKPPQLKSLILNGTPGRI